MPQDCWRLLDILRETSLYFQRKGLENPRLQAELLLADVLRLRRIDLYLQYERVLTDAEVGAYREHVRQRARRRPVQYIVGSAGFRHLDLSVHEGVLIPRPETEEVAGAVLALVRDRQAPRVLDLGCGTGAIGLAVAHEHSGARVVAVDLSPAAVRNARANAARTGLADRVWVVQGDLFAPLAPAGAGGGFDVVVSNPPYIPRDRIASLQPEVRDYEPHLALDGGPDGLDVYRRIVAEASAHLRPAGRLVLELGDGQPGAVSSLAAAQGLVVEDIRPDLNGTPRVLIASRREA